MAVATIDQVMRYDDDKLLSFAMNLVTKSTSDKLEECYNLFKEDISKYLLKTIIKQKINDSNDKNCDNKLQKISLIKNIIRLQPKIVKIEKLKMKSAVLTKDVNATAKKGDIVRFLADTKYDNRQDFILQKNNKLLKRVHHNNYKEKEEYDNFSSSSTCSGSNTPISINNNIIFPDSIKNESISTIKLLINGYIRNISDNINNVSILYLFEYFIGDISNINQNDTKLVLITQINSNKPKSKSVLFDDVFNNKSLLSSSTTKISQIFNNNKARLLDGNMIASYNTHTRKLYYMNIDNMPINYFTYTKSGAGRQLLDYKRQQLINFDANYHNIKIFLQNLNNDNIIDNKWNAYSYVYDADGSFQGSMSLCQVFNDNIAMIGGIGGTQNNLKILNTVKLYDINKNTIISLKEMNSSRSHAGSYYDSYNKAIIVAGGKHMKRSMEIYDSHKNKWFQIPHNMSYDCVYPCIWTIGCGQCIFVSSLNKTGKSTFFDPYPIKINIEWIDLRVCDKYRNNQSKWNQIIDSKLNKTPDEDHKYSLFRFD